MTRIKAFADPVKGVTVHELHGEVHRHVEFRFDYLNTDKALKAMYEYAKGDSLLLYAAHTAPDTEDESFGILTAIFGVL